MLRILLEIRRLFGRGSEIICTKCNFNLRHFFFFFLVIMIGTLFFRPLPSWLVRNVHGTGCRAVSFQDMQTFWGSIWLGF